MIFLLLNKIKKTLSCHDDKCFFLDNEITTVAWGHYSTKIKREHFVNHLQKLVKSQNE